MKREPLIQLKYRKSPWRLLVACVLLNRTRGTVADPVIRELFERWPTPKSLSGADTDELTRLIEPLGLQHQRALSLVYLSRGYRRGRYTRRQVKDLAGVGDYAADAYEMLVLGDLRVKPRDKELRRWLEWALRNPPAWAKKVPLGVYPITRNKIILADGMVRINGVDISDYVRTTHFSRMTFEDMLAQQMKAKLSMLRLHDTFLTSQIFNASGIVGP